MMIKIVKWSYKSGLKSTTYGTRALAYCGRLKVTVMQTDRIFKECIPQYYCQWKELVFTFVSV